MTVFQGHEALLDVSKNLNITLNLHHTFKIKNTIEEYYLLRCY